MQTLIERLALYILDDLAKRQSTGQLPDGALLNHCNIMKVIGALNLNVVDLTMDMHGNHVIQAFLMIFKASNLPADENLLGSEMTAQYTQFIFNACTSNCVEIGRHKHGCCVMQRCLEKGNKIQKLELANYIIMHMNNLIEDPYGNYLVQNVLKLDDVNRNEMIFENIAKNFIRLSQLKFSSNVIEKCLDSKMRSDRESPIERIFRGTFEQDDQTLLLQTGGNSKGDLNLRINLIVQGLIYNQFGNYVLQKAISCIYDEGLRNDILMTIKSLQPNLMQMRHGQKVIQKLSKQYPHIFTPF